MRKLLEILKRLAPPKCATCRGTGIVMVGVGWDIEPCECPKCNGTGRDTTKGQA